MAGKSISTRRKKPRRGSVRNCSNLLHSDILEEIATRLPLIDALRFGSVCSAWRSVSKSVVRSFLNTPTFQSPAPLLLIPNLRNDETLRCLGSSHGWLIYSNAETKTTTTIFILNPRLGIRIHLPPLPGFAGDDENRPEIRKVVLSSDPLTSSGDYAVVVLYNSGSTISFSRCGDTKWSTITGVNHSYSDIICSGHIIYALSFMNTVEIWDWSCSVSIPTKRLHIRPEFRRKSEEKIHDQCSMNYYIVESKTGILLIERYISEFSMSNKMKYSYKTEKFRVYRLNLGKKKWVEIKDLGDEVVFVGGNQSASLTAGDIGERRGNLICFTDDYWGWKNGHDMGVFDFGNGSMEEVYDDEFDLQSFEPHIWLLPPPKST